MLNIKQFLSRREILTAGVSVLSLYALPQITLAENKTTRDEIAQMVDAWANAYRALSQPEQMISLLAEDIFFEDPIFRLKKESLASLRPMIQDTASHFTSIQIEPGLVLIDPPWAAIQNTISGVVGHTPSEQRKIHVRGATFHMVENGKIKRWIDYYDYRTYSEQLTTG